MSSAPDYEVVVVGGGPVGLLLANLLGQRGVRTLVVERRSQAETRSMAIGITPPSLAILRAAGLDGECLRRGAPVETAVVHDDRGELGRLDFRALPPPYAFILCLPQAATVAVLADGLRRFPSVVYRRGVTLVGLRQDATGVQADLRAEGEPGSETVRGRFLAGCDGHASAVRACLDIAVRERRHRQTFLMADFDAAGGDARAANLFFTRTGSVEAFPLPGQRQRWVVMTDRYLHAPPEGYLATLVRARTGIDLTGRRKHFESPFRVRQFLSAQYHRGRVALCGDAAHVMSPIGGQGLNIGFGDAAMLADTLAAALRPDAVAEPLLRRYHRVRRRAFTVAAGRAVRGMWLGTRTGPVASWLRGRFIAGVLLKPPLRDRLPPYFAMLTIPGAARTVGP